MTTPVDGSEVAVQDNTPALPADLQDERLIASHGVSGAISAFTARLRSGDLGSVPVVVGLIIIWAVFQVANGNFLSSRNLVNLTLQTTSIGVIALGIVLVLLLGEIDLSVGSVSGLAAAVLGVTFVNEGWPLVGSLIVSAVLGLVIGLFYGALFTRFGVPSFVITLAGLLGFLGLQLLVLGKDGSLNLPFDSSLVGFAQRSFL
ncbi:MAG: D-xylose transport system permease protein, partial [Kribbellaceae bacterium]|nr:D-xylose transport system permease protein [Kribbellaceae bacterium]